MLEEDYNSQAAQDARTEMEREAKALAENEKELERMAKERQPISKFYEGVECNPLSALETLQAKKKKKTLLHLRQCL